MFILRTDPKSPTVQLPADFGLQLHVECSVAKQLSYNLLTPNNDKKYDIYKLEDESPKTSPLE